MELTAGRHHGTHRASLRTVVVASTAVGALLVSALASPAAGVDLPVPVVHYEFDDDLASGVVVDSIGDLDGTLVNPGTASQVAGLDGGALVLPGGSPSTGAYVELPREILAGAADLTVSMRVRWEGDGGPWQWMYALGTDTSRYLFSTPSNGDGRLRTAITTAWAGGESQVTGSAALPAQEWRTVTVTLDTGTGTVTTYLDGVAVSSAESAVSAGELLTDAAVGAGFIGRSFYPDPLFVGAVDDFQVFHTALTAEQVDQLVPGESPTLVELSSTSFDLRTTIGTAPALPLTIRASFTDGYERDVPVAWPPVPEEQYAAAGRFTVEGTAAGTTVTAVVSVIREGELSIDLGTDTGEFKGGAAGVLYGLYADGMPTDNLIEGFGLSTVATKGQDGSQHPGSDALEVLEQLARTSDGKVYIRTTDYYRGFPYQWPGDTPEAKLEGYFEVMATQLDQVAALLAERPDLVDNVVIEPFNEPEGNMFGTGEWSYDGTSWLSDPTDYFAAWDRARGLIGEKLPGIPVAGPGTSVLFGQVHGFLEHTLAAGTTPDIITWHELSNPAQVRTSVATFRAWEAELVAGTDREGTELPINVNEYAFNYHTSVPGQMIQWISAIEESKIEAMIAFWNMNGNLSDSAVQTNRGNGQWWLYNAYSAMTGHTVEVSPPQPGESYTLQGVATLDEDRALARALIGGKDGAAYVQIDNVPADVLGDEVRVTVREIPWTGQLGDSPQPRHVAELTAEVVDGLVVLDFGGATLPGLEASSAYEILITPAGTGTTTSAAPLTFEASYEAEDAAYTGGGYSRNGPEGSPSNVAGFYTSGSYNTGGLRTGSDGVLDFTVEVPEDGVYDLAVFSSTLNTYWNVVENGPMNVFLRVDGAAEQEVFLPLAYKWVVWDHSDTTVELTAGTHTISLAARSLDGTGATAGDAIIDRIVLAKANPAAAGAVYEAELADLGGAHARFDASARADVSGAGAADVAEGDELTFWVYSEKDGESTLTVDTVDGRRSGTATLTVNSIDILDLEGAATTQVHLAGGVNKIVISGDSRRALTIDRLVVEPTEGTLVTTTYEAEDGTLAGLATVVDLGLASGGKAIDGVGGEPGNANTLTIDVDAAVAGLHAVTVRFANPEQMPATHYNPNPMGRHADISVNGGEPQRVAFVPTFHKNNFWERTVVLDLAEGPNAVTFAAEVQPNWDGETYAEDTWPGLPLRSGLAPILDRITVSALSGEQLPPVWATDVSIADVLAQDTSGPETPRRANGDDHDLVTAALNRVLAARPASVLVQLTDPTVPLTAFLPDDDAVVAAIDRMVRGRVANETMAWARMRSSLSIRELEAFLLDLVVPGVTLTSEDLLESDGAELVTARGRTLVVSVRGGAVRLVTEGGRLVATLDRDRVDVNLGQVQIGQVVDRLVVTG